MGGEDLGGMHVLPYIEEHFFGEPDRIRSFELSRLRARLQIAP